MVTGEFVNVSAVRCVPPAAAARGAATVAFSVTDAYDRAAPLPELTVDPSTGRAAAVGVVTSGRQLLKREGLERKTSDAGGGVTSGRRALGWGDGWDPGPDPTPIPNPDGGGDSQRTGDSEPPSLWAEPTVYTYYDPHSPPSAGAATPPWSFNPLVTPSPRNAADADAAADGGDGAALVGDGAAVALRTAPAYGETRVVLAGSNFVPSARLACYFGDEQAAATLAEP